MISKMVLVCISQVMSYSVTQGGHTESGTVAYRLPVHCNGGMIEEARRLPVLQGGTMAQLTRDLPPVLRYEYPAEAQERALAAVPEKKAQPKAKKRKACKPGRWRDSRGICRRKR